MIPLSIMLLRISFWMSRAILQPCWRLYMKSIGNFFIFFFIAFKFFELIFLLHSIVYDWLFYFVRKNQKSHVCTNFVHKLFRIQSIAGQPLSYFEKLVSKENLTAADAEQKSKHRTWFTLTVEALNRFLYQVFQVLIFYTLFGSCILL